MSADQRTWENIPAAEVSILQARNPIRQDAEFIAAYN
jgi:hypothetical protein